MGAAEPQYLRNNLRTFGTENRAGWSEEGKGGLEDVALEQRMYRSIQIPPRDVPYSVLSKDLHKSSRLLCAHIVCNLVRDTGRCLPCSAYLGSCRTELHSL